MRKNILHSFQDYPDTRRPFLKLKAKWRVELQLLQHISCCFRVLYLFLVVTALLGIPVRRAEVGKKVGEIFPNSLFSRDVFTKVWFTEVKLVNAVLNLSKIRK